MNLSTFARWAAAAFALHAAAPAAAQTLVLDQARGPYVEAVINGVPLRLRVEFDLAPDINLNPNAAARARLGRGRAPWVQTIGPVLLRGRTISMDLTLAGMAARTAVRWHDRQVAADADGLVSIAALPFDTVTLVRRPASPDEREHSFEARVEENHGLYVPVEVGGQRIAARFSFFRERTIAPAAAAAVIARGHGGEIELEPGAPEEISLGVRRPVYPLQLERPLDIGGLVVSRLMVRTADFRGDHRLLRRAAAAEEGAIVVNGERRSQDPLYRFTIGLDVVGRCSAATYSRVLRTLRLLCAPRAAGE
jgi:hypothetical protein